MVVDANFTFKYSQDGDNYSLSGSQILKSFTYYEYETKRNDKKRDIYVVRSNYLDMIIDDMRQIMTYKDSSQYINKKTKSGDNIRI